MQTLEEKKAILQRAIDEGLRTEFRDPQFDNEEDWVEIYPIFLEDEWVVERDPTRGLEEYELKGHEFRIVEPRKTHKQWADDLAEAIRKHMKSWKCSAYDRELYDLARRYREQESKTANEVSEVGE